MLSIKFVTYQPLPKKKTLIHQYSTITLNTSLLEITR